MIESFDIENFRCFEQASLKDLRTINIIVGDNASGKTALGEALIMAASVHPALATRIRMARNRPVPDQMAWNRTSFESFWEDLFFDFDTSKKIKMRFYDSLKDKYEVEIYYDKSQPVHMGTLLTGGGPIAPLIFNRIGKLGKLETVKLEIDEKGAIKFEGNMEALPNFYAFASTQQYYTTDIINYFSELSQKGEVDIIVKAFQKEFPQIDDISILLDATMPSLFATLKHIKDIKVPLTIVSAGAAKYLNILLAVAFVKNGIVMIDEIENGIYWKKMPNVWKTLRNFCHNNGVQLFATTHSNECLQALLPAMDKNVEDFSLIRTEINDKGEYKIRQFYGKSFKAALVMRGEVR